MRAAVHMAGLVVLAAATGCGGSAMSPRAANDGRHGKQAAKPAMVKVTLEPETSLAELVTWAMGFTGKTVVFSTGVASRTQKVTIVAPAELSFDDAYALFLASLNTLGLTAVPKGMMLEIVPLREAAATIAPTPNRERMAKLRVLELVRGYMEWAAHHDKPCPPSVVVLAAIAPGDGGTVDPWGTPYTMMCGQPDPEQIYGFGIISLGPDKTVGTADDIKSWEDPT